MACLIQRNNGIYTVVYSNLRGRREWRSTGTRNRQEAQRIAEQIVRSSEKPRVITLNVFEQMVYQYAESNFSKGTVSVYKRSFQRLIRSTGDIIIKGVTPLLIEKFKQDCLKKVSATTANIYLRTIRAAFNLAKDWRLIDENPARSCKQIRVPDKEPVYLSYEEINTILAKVTDCQFHQLIMLAVYSGMRRGEICNLKWEDIDFHTRRIRIRNRDSFSVKGGHPRSIGLHPIIHRLLFPLQKPIGYVFVDNKGQALNAKYITRTFKKYVRISKLPDNIHFHSLRHTFTSLFMQAGGSLYELQTILGHRSLTTTQIYAHLENEILFRRIDNIDILSLQQGMN
jgi:integrase